jgi:hypothetical protein
MSTVGNMHNELQIGRFRGIQVHLRIWYSLPLKTYTLYEANTYNVEHSNQELTPRSRVLIKKLIVAQLVKKFPSFYGTRLGIFSSPPRQERLWGPLSLLSNGYQGLFPWG